MHAYRHLRRPGHVSASFRFFDWGPAWYQNASAARGRVAFKINETEARFNRSLITNTRVYGNSFTSVQGTATKLRRRLRLERATEWPFDLCDELFFGPPRPRAPGASATPVR